MINNPLLTTTTYPAFSKIKPKHILPALEQILTENRAAVKKLLAQSQPVTWQNLMQPLAELDERLQIMWTTVSHLHAVVDSTALRNAYNAGLPKLTAYLTEMGQNVKLYQAVKSLTENKTYKKLTAAQKKIINNELRDFKLAGVALPTSAKNKFAKLQKQLAAANNKFAENLLDATHGWTRLVTNKTELQGIPKHALTLAKHAAQQKKLNGWLFTLDQPSYLAVMTYANSHKLREEMYTAYLTRASDQGPKPDKWDNSKVMENILNYRCALTQLLDFNNYAEYSLATKMAKTPKQVLTFLTKLAKYSKPKAQQEYAELQQFARKKLAINELQPWDLAYCREKLQQHEFAISDEDLRPYFPEPQILNGMFKLAQRLFGITIKPLSEVETWHPDVKVFAIYDQDRNLISRLYLDLYARTKKRGGAWMNDLQTRHLLANNTMQIPIAFIVCNFSAPIGKNPALFTHYDVITLFHEFGHSLQHMLTTINYAGVSGINGVPWDAVEIASQFMENWCWQQPVLKLISKHYQTNKTLPKKLFDKMLAAKNFQSGLKMLRQLEFSLFDFRLHMDFNSQQKHQIQTILDEIRQTIAIVPHAVFDRFQHGFLHIFGGGYAAGYYSYKWAEVLASDAFAKFEEDGLFNQQTGAAFLHDILQPGGAVDPMQLFKKFRGRAPQIDALLKHAGINQH